VNRNPDIIFDIFRLSIKLNLMKKTYAGKSTNIIYLFPSGNAHLILVLFVIMLSGCSHYQYMYVSSHLDQNDKKEFIVENDSVQIKYTFTGENFPLTITLYNKLRQPIYIDLDRSTVVMNNIQLEGPFYRENQISFVAPFSYAILYSNTLRDQLLELSPKDTSIHEVTKNQLGLIYSFDEVTTPIYFRIILALTVNDDYSYPTFFDYSFWVSDILQTSAGPKSIPDKPSNQFYIAKTTATGKVLSWSGYLLLLVLSTLLLAALGG
jgi:hypothetical protein